MPRIVGSVKTPAGDHVMVSVYVTPKPNPVGSNNPVTDILVGGFVVQNTLQPVSIDLEPGTYDVRITGPAVSSRRRRLASQLTRRCRSVA